MLGFLVTMTFSNDIFFRLSKNPGPKPSFTTRNWERDNPTNTQAANTFAVPILSAQTRKPDPKTGKSETIGGA